MLKNVTFQGNYLTQELLELNFVLENYIYLIPLKQLTMGHDKSLHDGKKKREAGKSIKERRAEKKSKYEDIDMMTHVRNKPRWKKALQT